MDKLTADQCKSAVIENKMEMIDLRECSVCGFPTSYKFMPVNDEMVKDATPDDLALFGVSGVGDTAAFFDGRCDCNSLGGLEVRPWDNFAKTFNIQSPEVRQEFWERFLKGEMIYS